MFHKTAQVRSLGWLRSDGGVFHRVAEFGGRRADDSGGLKGYFNDGARVLDVVGTLAKVAAEYAISADPSDYLYEAIRANTTAIPNENYDAFPKRELLAFNTKLGMPVYMTYAQKPHHLNHKTDNKREARGVIIDAHYADETPPLDVCPRCASNVREASARTPDGLFCRKCGRSVKDEAVEILVAVDTKKDPDLAEGVRSGLLRAGSMGCNCVSTACHVCQHVAYSASEFCEHIRPGNKGTMWMRLGSSGSGGKDSFRRIEARALEREFQKRGYKYDLDDFVSVFAEDGFLVRKAHEDCQDVIFDEYSRVHQPADPKALQQEVLRLRASVLSAGVGDIDLEALRAESRLLIAEAKHAMVKAASTTTSTRTAQEEPGGPAIPTKSDMPTGNVPPGAPAEGEPPEVGGAGTSGSVDIGPFKVPPGYQIVLMPPGGGPAMEMGGPPPTGSPMPEDNMPQEDTPKSNEELGIMNPTQQPPPASARGAARAVGAPQRGASEASARKVTTIPLEGDFAKSYEGFKVRVSSLGTATIESPAGPVLLVRPKTKVASADARQAFGREVFESLMKDGLVQTAAKYNAAFSPRFASITDAAMNDMKGFGRTPSTSVAGDGKHHDMRSTTRMGVDSALAGYSEHTDMRNVSRRDVPSTLADGTVDHELGRHSEPSSLDSVSEDASDRRQKRPEFNLGKSDSTSGGTKDMHLSQRGGFEEPAGRKKGENMARQLALNSSTPPSAPGATAEVLDARYRKLYAAKLEKERAGMEADKQAFKEALLERVKRALKIVARRRSLNLEDSPLKAAAWDVLANDREVGRDAASGAPLIYTRMDGDLASFLVESAWKEGIDQEVESLVARAAELMSAGEQYIADAERDLTKQAQAVTARAPSVFRAAQLEPQSETEAHAQAMRREAMNGNPVFAPAPEVDAGAMGQPLDGGMGGAPSGGRFDRNAIRAALGDTKVNFIKNALAPQQN